MRIYSDGQVVARLSTLVPIVEIVDILKNGGKASAKTRVYDVVFREEQIHKAMEAVISAVNEFAAKTGEYPIALVVDDETYMGIALWHNCVTTLSPTAYGGFELPTVFSYFNRPIALYPSEKVKGVIVLENHDRITQRLIEGSNG